MKTPRQSLILITAFVLVICAGSFVVVRIMRSPVPGDMIAYSALFTDVSGLYTGDAVRISGVAVGKVESVELVGPLARVGFTVADDHRLESDTVIAVRYQNLVGQHYLEVVGKPGPAPRQERSADIPTSRTIPSFDVTALFNSVAPLIGDVDPKILNDFAENVALLLQGDRRGLGPAAEAVGKIAGLVKRRDAVLVGLVDNVSELAAQIEGRSGQVATLVENLNATIMKFTTRIQTVKESLAYGDKVLVPLVDLLETMQGSYDSNYGPLDAFMHRVVPFTPQLLQLLEAVPGLLDSMNRGADRNAAATYSCTNGRLDLPMITQVLVGGRDVVVCR
ncbi:MCE family protein [Gordonia sp. HY002]|uniref:MlaD family protein n=1 Tax=Gordonia zhenghanii TaxID=2911516 RepID=UPI001EEF8F15|nr:MlaD family protein [Gordonia zhenghanii]MCF8571690.1 MCE family protein [Gordonia zhenghanii]MCF8602713.1 MCE family protein [Gordonia zhenghanii]